MHFTLITVGHLISLILQTRANKDFIQSQQRKVKIKKFNFMHFLSGDLKK